MSSAERTPTGLMDLPGMVQLVASQRRTGVLVVGSGAEARRLRFVNGNLVAVSGGGEPLFARAVAWAGVASRPAVQQAIAAIPTTQAALVAQTLESAGVVAGDAMLDAIDCWVEEEFGVIAGWRDPALHFLPDGAADPWAAYQERLGIAVAPGGLLLEALRRQDELGSVADQVPDPWDVIVRESASAPEGLTPDALLLFAEVGEPRAARLLLDHPRLPPFRATLALVALRRAGAVRLATPGEIMVAADAAFAHMDADAARGLYRRAVALGQDASRIHLHLGELAERAGDTAEAAEHFRKAAAGLPDPTAQVVALRNALRLGADPEPVLMGLVAIYKALGETEEQVAGLLRLAEIHDERGAIEQAAQDVAEAQDLGADRVGCALLLARLAERGGDTGEAAIQLGLAGRIAHEAGRDDEAVAAWTRLLAIDPGLTEPARSLAQVLAARGQRPEALRLLRGAIAATADASAAHLTPVYELLTRLDPNDANALDWLAKTYQRQKNRDGAVQQLKLAAAAQERSNDIGGLLRSYEKIVELDSGSVDDLLRLADLRLRMGQDAAAIARFAQVLDLLTTAGDLVRARTVAVDALARLPAALPLRARLAQIAAHIGDRAAALVCWRAAANLAVGMGDNATARDMLMHICRQRPDDLMTRVRLAGLMEDGDPKALDVVLKDVVRCAVRTGNHGIAVEHARRRIAITPGLAYEQRSELVALLNRIADESGELAEGQKLLDDLLSRGEVEQAGELLARLVASQPQNAALVMQMAELQEGLGDERQAARFYRHAVPLLQLDGRQQDALAALAKVEQLGGDDPALLLARSRIERGVAVDWERIRQEFDHRERLRRAQEVGTGSNVREAASPSRSAGRIQPVAH
jgi:tetratricopeptide (TPR) repeat protein